MHIAQKRWQSRQYPDGTQHGIEKTGTPGKSHRSNEERRLGFRIEVKLANVVSRQKITSS
jgi:hypothetical protein